MQGSLQASLLHVSLSVSPYMYVVSCRVLFVMRPCLRLRPGRISPLFLFSPLSYLLSFTHLPLLAALIFALSSLLPALLPLPRAPPRTVAHGRRYPRTPSRIPVCTAAHRPASPRTDTLLPPLSVVRPTGRLYTRPFSLTAHWLPFRQTTSHHPLRQTARLYIRASPLTSLGLGLRGDARIF